MQRQKNLVVEVEPLRLRRVEGLSLGRALRLMKRRERLLSYVLSNED